MSNEKKRHVIPGEVIVSGPYRAEQNTVLQGDKVLATSIGLSDVHDGSVRVIPLTGGYYPKDDDLVIGKIISHSAMSWEVDINSCYSGMLPATDVFGRDFSSHSDDLSSKLRKGDLIATRIVNSDKTRDPLLIISGRELGNITGVRICFLEAPKECAAWIFESCVPDAPALAEIIMIDKETINNKKTLPVLSIPRTEIIKGAQAKGGTGLYNSIKGSKKPFANLFNPINNPKGTPIIIPKINPRKTLKNESQICP